MEIRVLGPLEVVADDGAVVQLAGKQRRLLAALTIGAGEVCSRDSLIEAVWDRVPPGSAGKVLQVYVSRLRKSLPEAIRIRTDESGYALELDRDSLDAARFERLLDGARESATEGNASLAFSLLDRALSLWRGEAYGELAYDDFARAEAERLDELRLLALEEQLEAGLQLGRDARLLPQLHGLVAAHPLRERLCAQLMLALYRTGRHTEALDAYMSIRTRLRDQLGLEPSAQLRELQRRILEHDSGLTVVTAEEVTVAKLPSSPNRLLGRERELDELRELLGRDDVRLLVLTGAGGSGKTRLALEAARQNATLFANGAALVELAPLRDPGLVLSTIAATLGVQEQPRDLLETVMTVLGSRELLLLVDNAEHLPGAAALYVELLARVPMLKLLVTSRVVLHLSGEHVYPVEPLARQAAAALFHQRAREAEPRFHPDANDERAIDRICARLDGLPLAIELAASRTRTLTAVELLERLEPRLPLLAGGPRDLPSRQQTLRATLAWSQSLLDQRGQDDLACLAVFAGGWTLEAAETVCGVTLDRLSVLVDHSVVQRRTTTRGSRYFMLETVREYGLERLEEQQVNSLMRRLGEYLVALADSVSPTDPVPGRGSPPDSLAAEFDNMRAAVTWALAMPDTELALQLATEFRWFGFKRAGVFSERSRWLDDALRTPGRVSTRTRARALETAARIALILGDFPKSAALAEASVRLYRELGDEHASSEPLHILGNATSAKGSLAQAKAVHEECLELATRLSDSRQVYRSLYALGEIERDLGNLPKASELLEQSAAFAREAVDQPVLTSVLHGLGDLALAEGDLPRAARSYRESILVARNARLWPLPIVVYCIGGLAAVAAVAGQTERAALLWGGVEVLEQEWGTPLNRPARGRYEQLIAACVTAAPLAFGATAERASTMLADEIIDEAL